MNDTKLEASSYRPLVVASYHLDRTLADVLMLGGEVFVLLIHSVAPALATAAIAGSGGGPEGEEFAVELGAVRIAWEKAVQTLPERISISIPPIREAAQRVRAYKEAAAEGQEVGVEELKAVVEILKPVFDVHWNDR